MASALCPSRVPTVVKCSKINLNGGGERIRRLEYDEDCGNDAVESSKIGEFVHTRGASVGNTSSWYVVIVGIEAALPREYDFAGTNETYTKTNAND